MIRHEKLQPLSRQHHGELLACLLLKKGIKKGADLATMQAFTRQFWQNDLSAHVKAEEAVLIPLLMATPGLRQYATVLPNDHQLIETIFERSQDGYLGYRTLELFARTLEDHIRFEERVVFDVMQQQLPAAGWDALRFMEEETAPSCDTYPVRFWE